MQSSPNTEASTANSSKEGAIAKPGPVKISKPCAIFHVVAEDIQEHGSSKTVEEIDKESKIAQGNNSVILIDCYLWVVLCLLNTFCPIEAFAKGKEDEKK